MWPEFGPPSFRILTRPGNSQIPWAKVYLLFHALRILWSLEYVNIQRFYYAPSMSIYRDFMVAWEYVNLQRFNDAPSRSDIQRFYGALGGSIYRGFAEILWCLECVNSQRFYDALFSMISIGLKRQLGEPRPSKSAFLAISSSPSLALRDKESALDRISLPFFPRELTPWGCCVFNRGQTQEHAQCTRIRSPAAKIFRAKI